MKLLGYCGIGCATIFLVCSCVYGVISYVEDDILLQLSYELQLFIASEPVIVDQEAIVRRIEHLWRRGREEIRAENGKPLLDALFDRLLKAWSDDGLRKQIIFMGDQASQNVIMTPLNDAFKKVIAWMEQQFVVITGENPSSVSLITPYRGAWGQVINEVLDEWYERGIILWFQLARYELISRGTSNELAKLQKSITNMQQFVREILSMRAIPENVRKKYEAHYTRLINDIRAALTVRSEVLDSIHDAAFFETENGRKLRGKDLWEMLSIGSEEKALRDSFQKISESASSMKTRQTAFLELPEKLRRLFQSPQLIATLKEIAIKQSDWEQLVAGILDEWYERGVAVWLDHLKKSIENLNTETIERIRLQSGLSSPQEIVKIFHDSLERSMTSIYTTLREISERGAGGKKIASTLLSKYMQRAERDGQSMRNLLDERRRALGIVS